jgi:RNA polymerase sigma-70 factor (ECF subfamily)
VHAAFASLSPQHRRVLELAYFEGMSQSQIAHALEAPLGTVKSWARQALVKMKALLPEGDLV